MEFARKPAVSYELQVIVILNLHGLTYTTAGSTLCLWIKPEVSSSLRIWFMNKAASFFKSEDLVYG